MSGLNDLVASLAQQALGMQGQNPHQTQHNPQDSHQGNYQDNAQGFGGLGGILGNILGGQQQGGMGGLGNVLGGALGGGMNNGMNTGMGGGLGSILGSVLGGANSSRSSAMMLIVVPLILSWIQRNGGLSGALDKLRGQGLDRQSQSWVSTGDNENIEPNQVQNLFDQQEIDQVAQQANTTPDQVYGAIASVLPQVVNSLTPQGPQTNHTHANDEVSNVLSNLGGLFNR